MATAENNLYLVRGWLIAKDAPPAIIEAIDSVEARIIPLRDSPWRDANDNPISSPIVNTPAIATEGHTALEASEPHPIPPQPLSAPEQATPRPRKPWSEAARAAARERAIARGFGKANAAKPKKISPERFDLEAPAKLAPVYAPPREDFTLTDSDWKEIKLMRSNGLPDVRIARSLGVEHDYLLRFAARKLDEEAEVQRGNV